MQPGHREAQIPGFPRGLRAPDVLQDLAVRHHAAGIAREYFDHGAFGLGQVHGARCALRCFGSAHDGPGDQVNLVTAHDDLETDGALILGPPGQSPDPRDELFHDEGLEW